VTSQLQELGRRAGHAYVILDGTLIAIDRVAADRPFYSGEHKKHGMNLQVIASPDGDILWVSGALPGSALKGGRAPDEMTGFQRRLMKNCLQRCPFTGSRFDACGQALGGVCFFACLFAGWRRVWEPAARARGARAR
jgi:DDE superfamily endonuclease